MEISFGGHVLTLQNATIVAKNALVPQTASAQQEKSLEKLWTYFALGVKNRFKNLSVKQKENVSSAALDATENGARFTPPEKKAVTGKVAILNITDQVGNLQSRLHANATTSPVNFVPLPKSNLESISMFIIAYRSGILALNATKKQTAYLT